MYEFGNLEILVDLTVMHFICTLKVEQPMRFCFGKWPLDYSSCMYMKYLYAPRPRKHEIPKPLKKSRFYSCGH